MTIFLVFVGLYIGLGIYERQKHDISSKRFGINENGWYLIIPDFESKPAPPVEAEEGMDKFTRWEVLGK